MRLTFYESALSFFIYSFVGWCLEVAYAAIIHRRFVNRGFLNGPICPIYGVGIVSVCLLLVPAAHSIPLLFVASVFLTSVIELVTGLLLEKIFGHKLWDYSRSRFNLFGYVTLSFSLLWGAASVVMVKLVQPHLNNLINWLPRGLVLPALFVFFGAFLADLAVTAVGTRNLRRRIRSIEEAAQNLRTLSDMIGEKISDGALEILERLDEHREDMENPQSNYAKLIEQGGIVQDRLTRAFPNLGRRFEGYHDAVKRGTEQENGPENDK